MSKPIDLGYKSINFPLFVQFSLRFYLRYVSIVHVQNQSWDQWSPRLESLLTKIKSALIEPNHPPRQLINSRELD